MKNTLVIGCLLLLHGMLHSQITIDGHVYSSNDEPLEGATIFFLAYDAGTSADATGFFTAHFKEFKRGSVIISYVGYHSDTLYILEPGHYDFYLKENTTLDEITVAGRKVGTGLANTVQKIETINAIELTKSACCDLAGCFNTQGSVQVNTTNIVTQSKELRLLGLSGVYNQILLDGMPLFMGNAYTFGVSHLPGTMIDQIMVAKGTSSILQGYDAISGQINVMSKKYEQSDALFLNGYINNFGETQLNYSQAYKTGEIRSTTSLHGTLPAHPMDMNGDNFIDMPLIKRVGVHQTLEYGDTDQKGYSTINFVQYLTENRIGGELNFDPERHTGTDRVYGHNTDISQLNMYSKHYYRWTGRQGAGMYASYQHHEQDSWFGLLRYQSNMNNLNLNAQFETMYGHEHLFKTGLSYRFFDQHERISFAQEEQFRNYDGIYHRTEHVPGVYAENTLTLLDHHLSVITGMRLDYHNEFGWLYTPRALVRYNVDDKLTLRWSGGRGYRTVNIFSDYAQIIGGTRNVSFLERPSYEDAWNTGTSIHYRMARGNWVMETGADFYYTYFVNQVFPDFDIDPLWVYIYNNRHASRSYSTQLDVKLEYAQWLEYKVIYNYLDVQSKFEDRNFQLPFINRHRVTQTLSVRPLKRPWYFDMNVHYFGVQRLPENNVDLPPAFHMDEFSDPYWIVNAQVTYKFKRLEIYGGVENITGFMQFDPIRSAENPFGPYFDISTVWGPTRGREYYLGFRFAIAKSE